MTQNKTKKALQQYLFEANVGSGAQPGWQISRAVGLLDGQGGENGGRCLGHRRPVFPVFMFQLRRTSGYKCVSDNTT